MINISKSDFNSMNKRNVEIVERKGFGHPDTICDSVANYVAEQLKGQYLDKCGTIYHYNMDKALLTAGSSSPKLGVEARLNAPIEFRIGDRATYVPEFNVPEFIEQSTHDWFDRFIKNLHHDDLAVMNMARPGSDALTDIFNRENITANDTSATVGYAPLSDLEQSILDVEHYLQLVVGEHIPAIGQDIKIMGIRNGKSTDITIATAIVAGEVDDLADYKSVIELIGNEAREFFEPGTRITVNALDDYTRGTDGLYLTNTGLSAEGADSGQVGRGNNPLGVIPLNRPMSAEAEAGKNSVSHVGKIYNIACYEIANDIHQILNPDEVYVWLVSQIGAPILEPNMVSVELSGCEPDKEVIEDLIAKHLQNL